MILTGDKIKKENKKGNIGIRPFCDEQVNPNSYNYRLGKSLKELESFKDSKPVFKEIEIPKEGYVLNPKKLYLGHTSEIIGSNKYSMSLIGRSSLGRLGLYLQISANLGHVTSSHKWTLELVALKPIIVYPEMIIGQVSFWKNYGKIDKFKSVYIKQDKPLESQLGL